VQENETKTRLPGLKKPLFEPTLLFPPERVGVAVVEDEKNRVSHDKRVPGITHEALVQKPLGIDSALVVAHGGKKGHGGFFRRNEELLFVILGRTGIVHEIPHVESEEDVPFFVHGGQNGGKFRPRPTRVSEDKEGKDLQIPGNAGEHFIVPTVRACGAPSRSRKNERKKQDKTAKRHEGVFQNAP
jgi:hypothetical protein